MELELTTRTMAMAMAIAIMIAVITMLIFHKTTTAIITGALKGLKINYRVILAEILVLSFLLAAIIAINGSTVIHHPEKDGMDLNLLIIGPILIAVISLVTLASSPHDYSEFP